MRNILVLENFDRLDEEISRYVKKAFEHDSVEILTELSKVNQNELISAIKKADIICFQTMMQDTHSIQNLDKISQILLRLKWFKEVRVLHGGQHFYDILNFRIDESTKSFIKDLMSFGLVIYEIFYEAYEDVKKSNSNWRQMKYYFDEVKMNLVEEIDIVWFILDRIPYIRTYNRSLYEHQPIFVHKHDVAEIKDLMIKHYEEKLKPKVKKEKVSLNKKFGSLWYSFLDEIEAVIQYRVEIGEENNDGDSLRYNTPFLKIIDELKNIS